MSVRKTPDGRWRVQVDVGTRSDGRRDRRTRTFRLKRDAVEQERVWLQERSAAHGLASCLSVSE